MRNILVVPGIIPIKLTEFGDGAFISK